MCIRDSQPTDDSAGSPRQRWATETTPAAAPGPSDAHPTDDCAESPCSGIAARSLLDRLLDEAESLQGADTAPDIEAERSSSAASTERAPSALRQRAEATHQAFS